MSSKPFQIINRDVAFSEPSDGCILTFFAVSNDSPRYSNFLGTLPLAYLPAQPSEEQASQAIDSLDATGSIRALFDIINNAAPDPRMHVRCTDIVEQLLNCEDTPSLESILASNGVDSLGNDMLDLDMLVTDLMTLITSLNPPRDLDQLWNLIGDPKTDMGPYRINIHGGSTFFGYRWESRPHARNTKGSAIIDFFSRDDTFLGPFSLLISAYYPIPTSE
jgi:hypothetical protein